MKKLNNKGFSLVELIVVIAIMAILAVTLAPRLVQYVERSREASDQEAINTIRTAIELAHLDDATGFQAGAVETPADSGIFVASLGADTPGGGLFTVTDGKDWKVDDTFQSTNKFYNSVREIVSDFSLKASKVTDTTNIQVTYEDGTYTVEFINY